MDRKFLFAFDLEGKDRTLTIDRVEAGELEGEKGRKSKKPLCYFVESKSGKPLALNATNCKAIAKLYGADIEGWAGQRITLYPTTTEMGGETVECIRVRPRKPPARNERPAAAETAPVDPPEPGSDG